MIKFRLFILAIVLFHVQLLNAQSDVNIFAKEIKTKMLKKHVYVLASDSCGGRDIGTNGIRIARDYIVTQWIQSPALKPYAEDSYLQAFSLIRPCSRKILLESKDYEFNAFDDFMYSGKYDGFTNELPLVFVGHGTDEEFEHLRVKGKAVFILNNNLRSAMKVATKAQHYGAELSIIANPEHTGQFESISRQFKTFSKFRGYRLPEDTLLLDKKFDINYRYFTVSPATIKKLSSHDLRYWRKSQKKGNHLKEKESFLSSVKVSIPKASQDTIPAYNVVSTIPGVNTDEYIIVGAHYDHLGVIDDEIYYGADDNATGTAALIEIARLFAKVSELGYKPKKNIIFAAFSAEEGGMCGSEYYVRNFSDPEKIKLMLNIDMIGRCDNSHAGNCDYFYFIENNLPDSIAKQNDALCNYYGLTPDYSSSVNFSDHRAFSDLGIPTIFYFDGKHQDLHKPTDTRTKIDYQRMTKISRVIFETIWKNAVMTKQ